MSFHRTIVAVLIGFSLAVMPVAAALAKPMVAMAHCNKMGLDAKDIGAKDMGAKDAGAKSMADCPCCDKAGPCSADTCAVKCYKAPCALPTAMKTFGDLRQSYERPAAGFVASGAWPPPAPPPRA